MHDHLQLGISPEDAEIIRINQDTELLIASTSTNAFQA